MSQELCIDPTHSSYDNLQLVCRPLEAGEAASDLPPNARTRESTPAPSHSSLFQRGENNLLGTGSPRISRREKAEFRQALLREAFAAAPLRPQNRFGSPLASSLWGLAALLPVACGSHPPLEGEAREDGGDSTDGSGGSDGGLAEAAPFFSGFDSHALSPCGAEGMITDLDEGLGVCANYVQGQHHLFAWNPALPGAAESIVPLTYPPDQVLRGADGAIYISTHQNSGLAVVRPTPGEENHHPFPASLPLNGTSSGGRSLAALRPSFPKGLVEIGGRVFVATSNYDEVEGDFQPGTVLAFDTANASFASLPTSAFNPTGVAEAQGRLLVVNSGAIDRNGHITSAGSLDVFHPLTFELEASLPLGWRGAGLAGEIALSADASRLVLPTADNSGRLIVVDWRSPQVREIDLRAAGIGGDRIFFSSLQISADGNFAVVSNFNDGRVYTVDLNLGHLTNAGLTVDDQVGDAEGLSDGLRLGAEYFLGFGPEVLRLQR